MRRSFSLAGAAIPLVLVVLGSRAGAQWATPGTVVYVNGETGDNLLYDGSAAVPPPACPAPPCAGPYRTISQAIARATNLFTMGTGLPVEIRVAGRWDATATPARPYEYSNDPSLPPGQREVFPLQPPPRTYFTWDFATSETVPGTGAAVPVAIRNTTLLASGGGNFQPGTWIFDFESSPYGAALNYLQFDSIDSGIDGKTSSATVKGFHLLDGSVGIMPYANGLTPAFAPRVVNSRFMNLRIAGSSISHYYPDATNGGRVGGSLEKSELIVSRSEPGFSIAVMEIGSNGGASLISPSISECVIDVDYASSATLVAEHAIYVTALGPSLANLTFAEVTVNGRTSQPPASMRGIKRGVTVEGFDGALGVTATFAGSTISDCALVGATVRTNPPVGAGLIPASLNFTGGAILRNGPYKTGPTEGHGVLVGAEANGQVSLNRSSTELASNTVDGVLVLMDEASSTISVGVTGNEVHHNGASGLRVRVERGRILNGSRLDRNRVHHNGGDGIWNVAENLEEETAVASPWYANNLLYMNGSGTVSGGLRNEAIGHRAVAGAGVNHLTATQNAGYGFANVVSDGGSVAGFLMYNSILSGNTGPDVLNPLAWPGGAIHYSDIGNLNAFLPGLPGQNNIPQAPFFVAPNATPPDFRLQNPTTGGQLSQAIDSGLNTPPVAAVTFDFEGNPRPYDHPLVVNGTNPPRWNDMGFDEVWP